VTQKEKDDSSAMTQRRGLDCIKAAPSTSKRQAYFYMREESILLGVIGITERGMARGLDET
jgi:hypothetical protein